MKRLSIICVLVALLFAAFPKKAAAQFKEQAFTQTYNDQADSLAMADSTDKLINFKEIFGGLAHKRTMRIGSMFGTSLFIPGASQIYNEQYWKLPIFYSGMVGGATTGTIYYFKFKQTGNEQFKAISTWSFVGTGLFYYASLMDGVISYKSDRKPHPGRATIYSILCPGLGQAYNGEYWKIPIYVGGIGVAYYFYRTNNTNYIRFRNIYREASGEGYKGPISADQAKYYRDTYRRYRDYSTVAMGLVYLLQIIDANVFCYMRSFDVSEDVAIEMGPTVIMPETYAFNPTGPAPGFSFGIRF